MNNTNTTGIISIDTHSLLKKKQAVTYVNTPKKLSIPIKNLHASI